MDFISASMPGDESMSDANVSLNKKVAMVTGSTAGIGLAIAQELARLGMAVVVTSRDAARAWKVANSIATHGGVALGARFSLETVEDGPRVMGEALARFGRLDVLINNALSQNVLQPLLGAHYKNVEQAITVNVTNTLEMMRLAHPHLKKTHGCVVNIGSAVCSRPMSGIALYSIVKAAVAQMTRALASEWAADRIRVNAIQPGMIRTQAFESMGMPREAIDVSYKFYEKFFPLGIGRPADVAKMAAFLCSDDAALMTGSIVDIDAGYAVAGTPMALV